MSVPVPFPASGLSATYTPWTKILVVEAKGEVPAYLAGAFLQREDWLGGLRFSLRAFPLGYNPGPSPPPAKKIDAILKVPISLPLPWFNSKSVIVETGSGDFDIKIKYLPEGPGPVVPPKNGTTASSNDQAGGKTDGGQIIGSVLPPIHVPLADGVTYRIWARVPPPQAGAIVPLPTVKLSFNSEFIKLVDSSHEGDSIIWDITWEKLPTGEGENPQSVDVTTSIPHTQFGGLTYWTRIVQPYTVEFIVFEKK